MSESPLDADIEEEEDPNPAPALGDEDDASWGDRLIVGELSARQRKVCELAAEGLSQNDIAKKLNYTPSRVSIILSNTKAKQLVALTRERLFEEGPKARLKKLTEPALNMIDSCLNDRLNRFKKSEQLDTAKWVIEMNAGKATQTHDVGENILGVLMDRLDALKAGGHSVPSSDTTIDVTPTSRPLLDAAPQPEPDDKLRDWVTNFSSNDGRQT